MEELTLNKAEIIQLQQYIGDIPFRLAAPIVALLQQAEARQLASAAPQAQVGGASDV